MFLCIDTATQEAGITLLNEEKVVGYLKLEKNQYADKIIEHIDSLIQKAGIELKDLKAVLAVVGPGSFTGLRVGISVANQFSHQLNIPLFGLTTDQFYKFRVHEESFLYIQSMNKDEAYIKGFGNYGKIITETLQPISKIGELKDIPWVGEVTDTHKEQIQELQELLEIHEIEEAWKHVIAEIKDELKDPKKYDLLEPYYGKGPNITLSKRQHALGGACKH